jgi:tetratricopeptide (TPR) repeat protein
MAILLLTYQNDTRRIRVSDTPFTIGRLPENDLCLEYDFVSGSHGRITAGEGEFVYEDLDSTNGTYISTPEGDVRFIKKESVPFGKKGSIHFGRDSGPEISFFVTADNTADDLEAMAETEAGVAFLEKQDFKKAFDLFENAIRKRPFDLPAYYYAGFAAYRMEDLNGAILRFEQYRMVRPDDPGVLMALGKAYERAGKIDKARHCYLKIVDKDPNNSDAGTRLNELPRFHEKVSSTPQEQKTAQILGNDMIATVEMHPFQVTYNVASHGRILTDLLKALKLAREHVGTMTDWFPSDTIPVTLLRRYGEATGRTGPEGIFFMIDPKHVGEKSFLTVLVTHEYAHYVLGTMTGFSPRIPWWLQEGFAQHVSQNLTPARLLDKGEMVLTGRVIPLQILEKGPGGTDDRDVIHTAYFEAPAAVAFLEKRHGIEGLRTFIRALKDGHSLAEAFRSIGTEYGRFEKEWTEWMAEGAASGGLRLTRELKKEREYGT